MTLRTLAGEVIPQSRAHLRRRKYLRSRMVRCEAKLADPDPSASPSRSPVCDAECRESLGRFPRMAFWGPEVEWHERDVVVPAFRQWLEAQGWETETETEFVDVVAHRGNETIYAEVKGRTNSRPGAGLDTLYGQLLRRMPAEEVGDPNTRFAVVIPTGAEAAALRVPRRVREVLRIDVYAVSDDGQVERLAD
jgi:hypothetical protein